MAPTEKITKKRNLNAISDSEEVAVTKDIPSTKSDSPTVIQCISQILDLLDRDFSLDQGTFEVTDQSSYERLEDEIFLSYSEFLFCQNPACGKQAVHSCRGPNGRPSKKGFCKRSFDCTACGAMTRLHSILTSQNNELVKELGKLLGRAFQNLPNRKASAKKTVVPMDVSDSPKIAHSDAVQSADTSAAATIALSSQENRALKAEVHEMRSILKQL